MFQTSGKVQSCAVVSCMDSNMGNFSSKHLELVRKIEERLSRCERELVFFFFFFNTLCVTTSRSSGTSTNSCAQAPQLEAHCLSAADAPSFQLCGLCCHLAAAHAVRIHCRWRWQTGILGHCYAGKHSPSSTSLCMLGVERFIVLSNFRLFHHIHLKCTASSTAQAACPP